MRRLELKGVKTLEMTGEKPFKQAGEKDLFNVICCGVCRTDAKMWNQGHRDLVLPVVPGHEMILADEKGRMYAVWPGTACGICRCCKTGRENLCKHMKIAGFHRDGGYADRVRVPLENLIPLPAGINPYAACFAEPVGCVINAFEKLNLFAEDRVLIFGGGTMGLITGLVAKQNGQNPVIVEKSREKIERVGPFLEAADLRCVNKTGETDFNAVINACSDPAAFGLGLEKAGRGAKISFFSGLADNGQTENSLLNLIHYKEAEVFGAYGLARNHTQSAVSFIQKHEGLVRLLIQETVDPAKAPALMEKVLSGRNLKFILDFAGTRL
ncbi:MAG: alcohol dehydrogenase catalytic domain-containing protein [Desulfobacteraceae bacterium]